MIDRQRPMLDPDLHPAADGEFVGMDLRLQAILKSSFEDARGLADRKEAFVTEHIDEICQVLVRYAGNHLIHYEIHIAVMVIAVGLGKGVRSFKKGINEIEEEIDTPTSTDNKPKQNKEQQQ